MEAFNLQERYPYAVYKGEELLMLGTEDDIVHRMEIQKRTFKYYLTESGRKRQLSRSNGLIILDLNKEIAD